jgi:PAS domain S-box-containing protein
LNPKTNIASTTVMANGAIPQDLPFNLDVENKRPLDTVKGKTKVSAKVKKNGANGGAKALPSPIQRYPASGDYPAIELLDGFKVERDTRAETEVAPAVNERSSYERNQENLKRLQYHDDQFRVLAEQSPDLILRFDRAGRILYANSKIEGATGFSPEALVGKTWAEKGIKPQCVAFWESLVEKTFATLLEQDEEYLCDLPTGSKIFQIRTAIELVESDEPRSVIAIARDITQRRKSEQDIMDLSQRLLYLVNHSPLAVVEWHPDGQCVSWDGEAESIFGWKRAEVLGSSIPSHELIHPTCRFEFEEKFEHLKNGTQSSAYQVCRTINKKGEVLHCEWFLSALRYDCGRPRSVLALVNDVTEREKADHEIKEMKEALESTVERRTALLRQANEELKSEIANRRQLEFELIQVSEREHRRIGHDLHDGICQELAGVRYALESISRKLENIDPLQKDLQALSDGILRAMHHTRILSRGLAPMELEHGDLVAALNELVENSSSLYKIECDLELRGEPLPLAVEPATHLFRIAQEALQNAVKHGRASNIHITLDFSVSPAEMVVRDNGSRDCPQPDQPKNGMGLKIMQHRAALLAGTVKVNVLESGGTEVLATFPKQTIPHAS